MPPNRLLSFLAMVDFASRTSYPEKILKELLLFTVQTYNVVWVNGNVPSCNQYNCTQPIISRLKSIKVWAKENILEKKVLNYAVQCGYLTINITRGLCRLDSSSHDDNKEWTISGVLSCIRMKRRQRRQETTMVLQNVSSNYLRRQCKD